MYKTRDLLAQLGVFQPKRIRKKNKLRFLSSVKIIMDETTHETYVKGIKGRQDSLFLLSEDIEDKDIVFITYYDTPRYAPKFKYEPLNTKNLRLENNIAKLMPFLLIAALFVFLLLISRENFYNGSFDFNDVLIILFSIAIFLITILYHKGFERKNNIVRNTSSVVSIIKLFQELDDDSIGLALVDNGCNNNYGLYNLFKSYDFVNKKVILLDCVGANSKNEITPLKQIINLEFLSDNSKFIHPSYYVYGIDIATEEVISNIEIMVKYLKTECILKHN